MQGKQQVLKCRSHKARRRIRKINTALCGSPSYFENAKKDLFAMMRQLGPASLFCSFSSAATRWTHLLRILSQVVDLKQYTDDELENLNWEEKCRLIQSDPKTCARHFDFQMSQFLRNFLLSPASLVGSISDWFYRVEYENKEVHPTCTCLYDLKMHHSLVQIVMQQSLHIQIT